MVYLSFFFSLVNSNLLSKLYFIGKSRFFIVPHSKAYNRMKENTRIFIHHCSMFLLYDFFFHFIHIMNMNVCEEWKKIKERTQMYNRKHSGGAIGFDFAALLWYDTIHRKRKEIYDYFFKCLLFLSFFQHTLLQSHTFCCSIRRNCIFLFLYYSQNIQCATKQFS